MLIFEGLGPGGLKERTFSVRDIELLVDFLEYQVTCELRPQQYSSNLFVIT